MGVPTLECVAEDVATVDAARRAVKPGPTKPVTLIHHRRDWCAVCPIQPLEIKVHAPAPIMPGQHKLPVHENEVPGTHGDGVTAEKFVSSVK